MPQCHSLSKQMNCRSPNRIIGVVAVCLTLFSPIAMAGKRVALIVGNANYQNEKPLKNPVSDARLIAGVLKNDVGFDDVQLIENAGIAKLDEALQTFAQKARGADAAVFYFSGHGVQDDGKRNYLIPVDAQIENTQSLKRKAMAADDVVASLGDAQPKITLIILDACRDNPFSSAQKSIGDGGGKGLSRVPDSALTEGMLIAYATREGQTAQDGKGANSPFAAALAENIRQREPILTIFDRVSASVRRDTNEKQRPIRYGDLPVSAYLLPPLMSEEEKSAINSEKAAWELIEQTADANQIKAFLIKYPKGALRVVAQAKLDTIQSAAKLAWEKVANANDPAKVREFLRNFSQSEQAANATARIASLEESACRVIQSPQSSESAIADYLAKFPGGKCAPEAEQLRRGYAEERLWKTAATSGLQGVREYLALYENGKFRVAALALLAQLASKAEATTQQAATDPKQAEKLLWESVTQIKTASMLDYYLTQYPTGLYAGEARKRLSDLKAAESSAWQLVEKTGDITKIRMFISANIGTGAETIARETLTRLEDEAWAKIQRGQDEKDVERYYRNFPTGRYLADVQGLAASRAEDRLWNEAAQGGEAALSQYIALYPMGRYVDQARERASWLTADKAGDSAAYRAMLLKYPNGKYAEQARKRLTMIATSEQAAWDKIAGGDDVAAMREFIKQHAQSDIVAAASRHVANLEESWCGRLGSAPSEQEARRYLEQFPTGKCATTADNVRRGFAEDRQWRVAEKAGLAGIREYLALYENGKFRVQALSMLTNLANQQLPSAQVQDGKQADRLLWESVVQIKTISAFEHYIEAYPQGAKVMEAKTQIAKLKEDELRIWQSVEQSGNVQKLRAYLMDNPSSPHADAARNKLVAIEEEAWQQVRGGDDKAVDRYLRVFPNGRYVNQVQTFAHDMAEDKLWQLADAGKEDALARYVVLYPTGKYASKAKETLDKRTQSLLENQPARKKEPVIIVPSAF